MTNANISIRTDAELKAKAQKTLSDLGLDLSTAVNLFLRQVVYKHGIPFEIIKPIEKKAKLGGWQGKITIASDFDDPIDDFKEYTE